MNKREFKILTLLFALLDDFSSIWMKHQTSTATHYKFLVCNNIIIFVKVLFTDVAVVVQF